ncbi:MAG: hypothetical protein MHM6MM_000100 [Cercozoa sp. M6MM]
MTQPSRSSSHSSRAKRKQATLPESFLKALANDPTLSQSARIAVMKRQLTRIAAGKDISYVPKRPSYSRRSTGSHSSRREMQSVPPPIQVEEDDQTSIEVESQAIADYLDTGSNVVRQASLSPSRIARTYRRGKSTGRRSRTPGPYSGRKTPGLSPGLASLVGSEGQLTDKELQPPKFASLRQLREHVQKVVEEIEIWQEVEKIREQRRLRRSQLWGQDKSAKKVRPTSGTEAATSQKLKERRLAQETMERKMQRLHRGGRRLFEDDEQESREEFEEKESEEVPEDVLVRRDATQTDWKYASDKIKKIRAQKEEQKMMRIATMQRQLGVDVFNECARRALVLANAKAEKRRHLRHLEQLLHQKHEAMELREWKSEVQQQETAAKFDRVSFAEMSQPTRAGNVKDTLELNDEAGKVLCDDLTAEATWGSLRHGDRVALKSQNGYVSCNSAKPCSQEVCITEEFQVCVAALVDRCIIDEKAATSFSDEDVELRFGKSVALRSVSNRRFLSWTGTEFTFVEFCDATTRFTVLHPSNGTTVGCVKTNDEVLLIPIDAGTKTNMTTLPVPLGFSDIDDGFKEPSDQEVTWRFQLIQNPHILYDEDIVALKSIRCLYLSDISRKPTATFADAPDSAWKIKPAPLSLLPQTEKLTRRDVVDDMLALGQETQMSEFKSSYQTRRASIAKLRSSSTSSHEKIEAEGDLCVRYGDFVVIESVRAGKSLRAPSAALVNSHGALTLERMTGEIDSFGEQVSFAHSAVFRIQHPRKPECDTVLRAQSNFVLRTQCSTVSEEEKGGVKDKGQTLGYVGVDSRRRRVCIARADQIEDERSFLWSFEVPRLAKISMNCNAAQSGR